MTFVEKKIFLRRQAIFFIMAMAVRFWPNDQGAKVIGCEFYSFAFYCHKCFKPVLGWKGRLKNCFCVINCWYFYVFNFHGYGICFVHYHGFFRNVSFHFFLSIIKFVIKYWFLLYHNQDGWLACRLTFLCN